MDTPTQPGTLQLAFKGKRANAHPNPGSYDSQVFELNKRNKHSSLTKRTDEVLELPLENLYTYYNVEIELGTPAQNFNLLVDTGSSDLWVIEQSNPYCAEYAYQVESGEFVNCTTSGTFNSTASETFNKNSSDFFIKYGDGTVAEGDWATDIVSFQNATIKDMSFGLGTKTNSTIGVLGIGYTANEASQSLSNSFTYANLPIRLTQEGVINMPAYSLWLNDLTSTDGSLLFGGVDHAKYSGSLQKVPILKSTTGAAKPEAFLIAFTSLNYNASGETEEMLDKTYEALLDSGTSLSYFPVAVATNLLNAFDATYNSGLGYYIQSCNLQGSLDYSFSGATVSVPFSSLLLPVRNNKGTLARFTNGDPVCAIGILPASYPFALLGDTFLRSAYVVYDLENDEIALAQGNMNVNDTDIEVISNSIPSATKASAYSSTSGITLQTANAASVGGGQRSTTTIVSTGTDGSIETLTLTRFPSGTASKSSSSGSSATSTSTSSAAEPNIVPTGIKLWVCPFLLFLVSSMTAVVVF